MTHSRMSTRVAAGLAAGALLALAVPMAASAHVEVGPDSAPAGATTPLTFTFDHGCKESPTTALQITIPAGIGNVTPVVEGGWSIDRTTGANGVPTQVTYTAAQPIESGLSASVSMDVLFDTPDAGKVITFPVLQKCVAGSTSWTQVPAAGQNAHELDTPAPAVTVGPAQAPTDEAAADAHAAPAGPQTPAQADPVARWLGAGGLAAGVIALVVAITAATRRRAKS
ncbi:hypothetical protein GCM10022240_10220 [Microbacterium kribbense]|uniref:YncI copper-binding domain-containing protein n=1 Tax=Microbacterium kribbense TaxID=433645 RepID=A0ABP7GDQ4_9MICO